jgi:hypothetical protein
MRTAFALLLAPLALSLVACAEPAPDVDGPDDRFVVGGKVDGAGIPEDGAEALAVLEVVNTLSVEALDADEAVGLDRRAARNIVARRDGEDRTPGTEDDRPFETLWELDAIPYVGPVAFDRLLDYAHAQGFVIPDVLDVHIVGAVIGFGEASGTQWDSFEGVDAELLLLLAEILLGPSPYLEVLELFLDPITTALSHPDPYGTAELLGVGAVTLADRASNAEETFQPIFPGAPGWDGVAYDPTLRIRVTLHDEDPFWVDGRRSLTDDPIGVVDLGARDLYDAWRAGEVWPVAVADQSSHQLLFVRIAVTEAR